jgi:hypothetical protein
MARRIAEIAFQIIVALSVLGAWFAPNKHYSPHEGDACGPGHHWVYVRDNVTDPDLSCESD